MERWCGRVNGLESIVLDKCGRVSVYSEPYEELENKL